MRSHVLSAIAVLFASLIFQVSKVEILILLIAITLVVASELINTALESAVDATTNYYHPLVKEAKMGLEENERERTRQRGVLSLRKTNANSCLEKGNLFF